MLVIAITELDDEELDILTIRVRKDLPDGWIQVSKEYLEAKADELAEGADHHKRITSLVESAEPLSYEAARTMAERHGKK